MCVTCGCVSRMLGLLLRWLLCVCGCRRLLCLGAWLCGCGRHLVPPIACWCSAVGVGVVCITRGCVSRLLGLLLW